MVYKCKVCSAELFEDEKQRYFLRHGVMVCDRCAGKIHNAYEQWHGGASEWPTGCHYLSNQRGIE